MVRARRPDSRLIALLLLAAISACRSLPPTAPTGSWPERCATLIARSDYSFSGRIAARSGTAGFSAGIDWRQHGDESEATLRGPLGVGAVRLQMKAGKLTVHDGSGELLGDSAGSTALRDLLGFEPPVDELRYWLLACSAPGAPAVETSDQVQRLATLAQGGWQLEYPQYQETRPYVLPARIRVHRDADSLQLVINHWQLP
jgi:outer membrane lipoprotein LolB